MGFIYKMFYYQIYSYKILSLSLYLSQMNFNTFIFYIIGRNILTELLLY